MFLMSLRFSPSEETPLAGEISVAASARGFEKISNIFADVAAKISSLLHAHALSRQMQSAIALADKEMAGEVCGVPGGHEVFLAKISGVPWMKPLLHMVNEESDELRFGKSVLAVDFKGYSSLLAEGKIPPDILLQFMARFYAGVTEIAKAKGGLLFRTPMGDRVEFAFGDPLKAEAAAQKVESFMCNVFFDNEWKKRLSHFGIPEDRVFEAHIDPYPNKRVAIKLLRFSPRRTLPIYSMEDCEDGKQTDELVFEKDVRTAVAAARLCPMRPAAMMAEKPDMAREYKFVAGFRCMHGEEPLFTSEQKELMQKIARAILQECASHPAIQVFKAGEKGEVIFLSRNSAELLKFVWDISKVCRESNVRYTAGVFGGVFHAGEIYREVQPGWPDVHGTPYARAIRAANLPGENRIVAGQEVIDSLEDNGGIAATQDTVALRNMGSLTVYAVNNVGDVKLRTLPAQDIEQLKRRLAEAGRGEIFFEGNLKSACSALRREGHESMYVKCSPRTDIARKIVMQLVTFFEQNSERIIEQVKENPRSLVDFLEAHGICIEIFIDYADKLAPRQRVFADELLKFSAGTKIIRIVSSRELKASAFAGRPELDKDAVAQETYSRFVRSHEISEPEEDLIILFFLAGESLHEDDILYYLEERTGVLDTAQRLKKKKILDFDATKEKWSLAVDPELLEGCQMRKIRTAEEIHGKIGEKQHSTAKGCRDSKEKMRLLCHAVEHLAACRETDIAVLAPIMDEVIRLCDSARDYKLAFEYVDRKSELLKNSATGETPRLRERKEVLAERSRRARNLNKPEKHLDSLRQLLDGEMDAILTPAEKLRMRMYLLTALAEVSGPEAQEEFYRTQEEIFAFSSPEGADSVSSNVITQFQHLASTMSRYRDPPQGRAIYNLSPEDYESFIEPLAVFYEKYKSSLDTYVAITIAKLMAAYIYLYLLRGGNDFARVETWLRFAEDIARRHKERFIETEKLTKDIGKLLYNLAISRAKMARDRKQVKQQDVAENILKRAYELREHAQANADDENLGLSLHLEIDLLAHQGHYDRAWELNKKLLTIDMEPAKALILYINSAEYLYNLSEENNPEGDLVLAWYYLNKAWRLLSKIKRSLMTESHIEEFKKWNNLIAAKLGKKPLMLDT